MGRCNIWVQVQNPGPPRTNFQCSEVSLGNLLTISCDLRPRCCSPKGLVIMILTISGEILKEHSLKIIFRFYILKNAWQKKKNHVTHGWQGCEEIGILINCWTEVNWHSFFCWRAIYKPFKILNYKYSLWLNYFMCRILSSKDPFTQVLKDTSKDIHCSHFNHIK